MPRSLMPRTRILLLLGVFFFSAAATPRREIQSAAHADAIPWRNTGLTKREAAAHLLSRFTWGVRPEDVELVERVGLEQWLENQLAAKADEIVLNEKLKVFHTLGLTNAEIARTYPAPGKVILELMQKGVYKNLNAIQDSSNKDARREALKYAYQNGYRPQKELLGEMVAAKILRAVYANNQLQDVLSDFWMNHFSVSMLKVPARQYIPTYERDAIRPNALGNFHDLLLASAKHPAMLLYLDNAQSTAPLGCPTTASLITDSLKKLGGIRGWITRRKIASAEAEVNDFRENALKNVPEEFRPRRGFNENYARELLELHTLGVDGGYTQSDVSSLARVLSGWTMMPYGYAKNSERAMAMIERGKKLGVVVQGDFLFRADAHDATAKDVLDRHFPAGHGLDEGEQMLQLLSEHPSTAHRIALKLCTRFVSDTPPERLVQQVAQVFKDNHGSVPEMIRCIVYSEDFWSHDALRAKIKTPFELVVSAIRVCHAQFQPTKDLYDRTTGLGQQLYAAPAPTGFPDQATAWVNSGSLISRMNFAQDFVNDGVRGLKCPAILADSLHEAESQSDALRQVFARMLPERDVQQSIALLLPRLQDDSFQSRLAKQGTNKKDPPNLMDDNVVFSEMELNEALVHSPTSAPNTAEEPKGPSMSSQSQHPSSRSAEQQIRRIMALVLGSPEFQRR